ncbi:condensation domain-containing protein [Streptomyces justiciae]|uniref:condensation domain-containing protein n=1 Tax=Streptomyces justiciae TaxID=2780140 RepID=UPI00211847CF|nr:condensation domain-containing protein [Streptomyces justiciae]MCW8384452.1 condensation domain-containing protein [Streptomyces justiciae]
MTVARFSPTAVSVVVSLGPSAYPASWDLEVRGPIDAAVLERALEELAPGDPVPADGRHRLVRHGRDHHTLRLTPAPGTSVASLAGRIADLLTEPPAAEQPLTPAQCAVLAPGQARYPRYEAVFVEANGPLDAGTVRQALRRLLAAHPQLTSRADATRGRLTPPAVAPDAGAMDRQEPLTEGEFTDEADFSAAVAALGRTVDARTGVQLRALLARDRRPTGPRADRLAVVADRLAVDDTSWHILIEDLAAFLDEPENGARPSGAPAPGTAGLTAATWAAELRELADDPEEARHWTRIAERRARMINSRWSARVGRPQDVTGSGPADVRDKAPGPARHTGFIVDAEPTERIAKGLARRLALTTGQVLTGVFALALARWQRVDEVSFDVRSDPRADHSNLRRHVGRLTDVHPVHLALDPALDLLGQLAAMAGPLAAGAGQAAGGAGFGACREWSPDPLLREALRGLPPAQTCLVLPAPIERVPDATGPLPGAARPVPGSAPKPSVNPLQVRFQVVGDRLHIGLDWVSDPVEGITDASVAALGDLLRELLEELAETSTAPIPSVFRATPQQTALYTGGDAQPGTGRHVEQVVWLWHGPLDVQRFTAAWQSVFDCETVLRTAFTGGPEPQLMVHSRVTPDITNRVHTAGDDLSTLLERDRLRGFDLRCPPAMRLTLLQSDGVPPARTGTPTRIVLTYHRALLDNWSVHILLREFYRAYLGGGALPGGERRPDLRDYAAWVAAQDLGPARGFWARSAPPAGTASRPGRPAGATGGTGVGRSRLRLDAAETIRLARWAGRWGVAESSVLQAVWAMLIYRASGATAPAPVSFAVTVPGRGIPLDGVSRMLGPLRNSLLMSVDVDPAGTVPGLLRQLRDRALDMAAYEWVPGDWIHGRREAGAEPADTVIVFEDPPHPVEGLENELAAQGLGADFPGTVPARSVLPIGLLAHHDKTGGLVFTGVHDRDVLDEEAATELLVQSALLLRELPLWARESTTVGEALKLLEGRAVPPMAEAAGAGPDEPLVTLRAAREEQAGTVCLVPPPGAPPGCYDLVAHAYTGPRRLLVLTAGTDTDRARSALAALPGGRQLVLGGYSGAGALACDLARHLAADGDRPPRVVLAGASTDAGEQATTLAQALNHTTRPHA